MNAPLIRPFAEQGHFTAVHNLVFRQIMPLVSDSAFKVLCFVISETIGYNRKNEALSYADIKAGTGIKSDATVARAVAELLEGAAFGCPLILRRDAAQRGVSRREKTRYAINKSFTLALQKMKRENLSARPTKNEGREKVRPSKNEAYRPSKNEARKSPPIRSARNPIETSNETSSSLSLREATENFTEDSSQIAPQTPDFSEPHFRAICEVCRLDPDLMSPRRREQAIHVAQKLAPKYTPDQVRLAGSRWEMPTPPHPTQLLDRLPALLSVQENSDATTDRSASKIPSKFESAAERRGRDLTGSLDSLQQRRADLEERKRHLAGVEGGGFGNAGIRTPDRV